MALRVLEICAGAGGQSVGLELAGFHHAAAVEIDRDACQTLRLNRPDWNVIEGDVRAFDGHPYRGIDLLAGGVSCTPFSIAGKKLGAEGDRNLFSEALRLVEATVPKAVMLENVRGLATATFFAYRDSLLRRLSSLGYEVGWRVLVASDFGVPQLRTRFLLVALKPQFAERFWWPVGELTCRTVGEAIGDLMGENGWPGVNGWIQRANGIGPTLVGGSRLHGGPDLGPSRVRAAWARLGVDGGGIAKEAPGPDFPRDGLPRLTVRMAARLQGFPDAWEFAGRKTAAYRQVGNAFPPPVAAAVAGQIFTALSSGSHKPEPVRCTQRV